MAAGDHDNSAAVRNCTLEEIDEACLEYQRYELSSVIRDKEITNYAKNSLETEIEGGPGSQEHWFNCTRSQSSEHLSPRAVSYILEQIR